MVNNRTLRISQADKGGAVVVQDYEQYEKEAWRQLDKTEHYEVLHKNPTKEVATKSNAFMKTLLKEGTIDEKCYEWGQVNEETVRTHTFHHLPKIHKDCETPPGRPIIAGNNGPTERLSKLVDHWLQPIVQALPSYLRDTTHFLQAVEAWKEKMEPIQEDVLIVTVDVVALYPSIPHEEVSESLQHMLRKNRHLATDVPRTPLLLDIVNHILKNNVFDFDGHIFRQIHGTAMGTPMAPAIANLFMGWVEERLLPSAPYHISTDLWRRFIDDVIMLWTHGEEKLTLFLDWLNKQHPTIKFTAHFGRSNIPFLDTSVSIKDGHLVTDLHRKPSDANMYLPFTSSHPRHCVRAIPYGQCLRLRRICSDDATFKKRCMELEDRLRARGYPSSLIQAAINKVSSIPRESTLRYVSKPKENSNRVPFIVTHNPSHPPLSLWLREGTATLHTSRRMKEAMPDPPIVGERTSRSLRNLLMPSRPPVVKLQGNAEAGCKKCGATRCILCQKHLRETETFRSVRSEQTFTIRDSITCKANNVIYLIDCAKCEEVQYVGETGQTLQRRIYGHRSNIKKPVDPKSTSTRSTKPEERRETLVARHFQIPGHTIDDLKVTAIEQIKREDPKWRKEREKFWRHKLRTNYPQGLNVWD